MTLYTLHITKGWVRTGPGTGVTNDERWASPMSLSWVTLLPPFPESMSLFIQFLALLGSKYQWPPNQIPHNKSHVTENGRAFAQSKMRSHATLLWRNGPLFVDGGDNESPPPAANAPDNASHSSAWLIITFLDKCLKYHILPQAF